MKDVLRTISEISSRLTVEKRKVLADLIRPDRESIAVIGIGCRFPGGADDAETFWALLRDGVDAIGSVPEGRWDAGAYFTEKPQGYARACSRWGGFLTCVDGFDARFFGIAPREAIAMDPQQRLLLEVAWESLENAGIAPERLMGSRTGSFVGISTNDYAHLVRSAGLSELDLYAATGTNASVASGRLSYFFGLQGPSVSVDTACSSSLVAVHLAIRSLRSGESDLVLAGGVNLMLSPEYSVCFANGQMLAADGRCKTFDAAADGYVRGEGCGVIVLKRLSEAIKDGDHVLAVLRGSAINQDGKSSGLTVPNGLAQERLIRDALADARLNPIDVGYVEAHGTGTSLGDPIEVSSLAAVLGEGRSPEEALLLGSVKTNIGHLEAAAGIAGLIKSILVLEHGEIPPHLNLRHPTPYVPWDRLPVIVPTRILSWNPAGKKRIAGVSSFGFSGTNAHILLEEAPPPHEAEKGADRPAHILALSAMSAGVLSNLAGRFACHLEKHPEQALGDICFTANSGRSHFPCRVAVLGRSHDQMRNVLEAYVSGRETPGLMRGRENAGELPGVVFLFTGQGSEYAGMDQLLYQTQPVFREAMDRCDELLRPYLEEPLLHVLHAQKNDGGRLHETVFAQPALFALEYACCALWRSWGVVPSAVLGHSLGEYVAACVAGVLNLEDALKIVAERGRLMQSLEPEGMMLAALASRERVSEAIAPYAESVSIAAENSPENIVVSGKIGAVQTIRAELERDGIRTQDLKASRAFHSPLVEPVLAALERAAGSIKLSPPTIRLISNLTGRAAVESEITVPTYWRRHARETVKFSAGIETLREEGYELFVEVGPGSGLLTLGQQCVGQGYGVWLPTIRRTRNDGEEILESLAALYAAGVKIDWAGFDGNYKRRKVSLPTYPFDRQRYWLSPRKEIAPLPGLPHEQAAYHPLLGRRLYSPLPEIQFESRISSASPGFLSHHSVHGVPVLPASAYIEMMLTAAVGEFGRGNFDLVDLTFGEALLLSEGEVRTVQTILLPAGDGSASARVLSLSAGREGETPIWTLHASASLCPGSSGEISHKIGEAEDQSGLVEIPSADFYEDSRARGIDYGERFQGIVELRRGNGTAVAKLCLPASLGPDLPAYGCHPALLDAGLQVAAAIQPDQSEAFMPFSIERVRWRGNNPDRLDCRATLRSDQASNRDLFSVDLELKEAGGEIVVSLEGLSLKRAPHVALHSSPAGKNDWLYEVTWHPQDLPIADSAELGIASPNALSEHVSKQWRALSASHGLEMQREANRALDDLCISYIENALTEMGWKPSAGDRTSVASLTRELKVAARHRRLLGRILQMLEDDGLLRRETDGWKVLRAPQVRNVNASWLTVIEKLPSCSAELGMLRRCGERLAEVLRGEVDALELLFPEGSHADAEQLYEQSPFSRVYNAAIAEALKVALERIPAGRKARVLEIGAGTGGTASWVLKRLEPQKADYVFTDVSPLFLNKASDKFRHLRHVSCRMLDIELDPAEQGFESERFDCLLAVDVLHATRNLRESLKHAAQLLSPGGLLLILEGTSRIRWVDLVFGLTEGWWRFQDLDIRSDHPLLSTKQWLELLDETGFEGARAVPEAENSGWQTLFVARSPECARVRAANEEPGRWLIFSDRTSGSLIAQQLGAANEQSLLVFPRSSGESHPDEPYTVDPLAPEEFAKLYREFLRSGSCRGVLYLWGMESEWSFHEQATQALETSQRLCCAGALHAVQMMVKAGVGKAPPLWFVTRGAQAVAGEGMNLSVAQASLWGLARVVAQEHPDLMCGAVDLDPLDDEGSIKLLLAEILAGDGETQSCYRGRRRYVARLRRARPGTESEVASTSLPDAPFRLSIDSPGVLSNLRLQPYSRVAPSKGQVEIRVVAAGLNFRDVMIALGAYHADSRNFGMECAGQVVGVGEGVHGFAVGDEVVGIAPGSFASFAVTSAELVVKKPPGFGFDQAAAIPVAFLTAYYSLCRLARLTAGERVLIHSAAGGVGLAAVRLALKVGAETFATAGNDRKRSYLRSLGVRHVMDSRSLDFAEEVLEKTAGRGVDVVLNSLAGEFIPKSLSVMCHGGRFVEIGRTDIWSPERVSKLRGDVEYHTVALDLMMDSQPKELGELLRSVFDEFGSGALNPLPIRVFQVADIIGAFRHMERSRHIGKIVVAFENNTEGKDARSFDLRSDSTYLITGGFGGLGNVVAKWMVENGARHLLLTSRRSASEQTEAAAREMVAQGAEVVLRRADIAIWEDVARLLAEMDATMPPLAGVVHAAGVLDDGLLMKQEWERFETVMKPKVSGAWNLHLATRERDLDFFVMFSSAASLLGTPGQGNHAAANAFLDALAHFRRREGLPAVSIDWGAWSEIGSAVGRGVEEALRLGLGVIRPDDGLRALEQAMKWDRPQLMVLPAQWQRYLPNRRGQRGEPFFEFVSRKDRAVRTPEKIRTERQSLVSRLMQSAPAERLGLLRSQIQAHAIAVLGIEASQTLDWQLPLQELGLDSLMALELRNALGTMIERQLPATLLFDHPTIAGLTEYLAREVLPSQHPPVPTARSRRAAGQTADLLERVESLSEDEVERLLKEKL